MGTSKITPAKCLEEVCLSSNNASVCNCLENSYRHQVLFSYDDDEIEPASFLTYKFLPLGKTEEGLNDTHNA